MATTPAPTLTCAQCGYTNEAERVYCHNCGTKLDRSLLPKEEPKQQQESVAARRRRVRRMTNPDSGMLPHLKKALSVLFYAAIVATLVLIALPPENVPGKPEVADRMLGSELLDAVESPQPRQLVFSENDVNAHLRSVRSKVGDIVPGMEFKRAFAQLEPGKVRIGIEETLFGYSMYWTIDEELSVVNGKFTSRQVGGHFGRLGLHPALMEYAGKIFSKLWTALKREQEQLGHMLAVRVEQGRIIFVTNPAVR
jgi:hypothetical protein